MLMLKVPEVSLLSIWNEHLVIISNQEVLEFHFIVPVWLVTDLAKDESHIRWKTSSCMQTPWFP